MASSSMAKAYLLVATMASMAAIVVEASKPIFLNTVEKPVFAKFEVDNSLDTKFDEGIVPNPWKSRIIRKARVQFLHAEYTNVLNESMYGIPEEEFPPVSDDEWTDLFFSKLRLWSNYTFDVAPQYGNGLDRIDTGLELNKNSDWTLRDAVKFKDKVRNIMRAKSKGKKNTRDGYFLASILGPRSEDRNSFEQTDEHETDDDNSEDSANTENVTPYNRQREFLAKVMLNPSSVLNPFNGNGSGSGYLILKNSSLPCAWHEFIHNLGLGHSLRANYRHPDGTWKFLKEYGDVLSTQGGSKYIPPIDEPGPAGVVPAQAHRLGWLHPEQFIYLVPGRTYRLRTPDAFSRTEPCALVWYDRTYGTNHWFSFWKSASAFDESYEKEQGSNAHGGNRGWSDHAVDDVAKITFLVNQFGKDYSHHTGLHFKTLSYGDDYIEVYISYKQEDRRSWEPEFDVTLMSQRSGSKRAAPSVNIALYMLRENIAQEDHDPFLITREVRAECDFGKTYNNGKHMETAVMVSGGHTGKRDHIEKKGYRYRLKTNIQIRHPQGPGPLADSEKGKKVYCDLFIGKFLKQRVGFYFA